jgi:2-amino-4-hydroxy-6-hydroxymethyldihydropteridine diphosphokinase
MTKKARSPKIQRGTVPKPYRGKWRSNSLADKPLVIVALGANLGNSKAQVLKAIDRLRELSDQPLQKSSLWETAPVDCPPGSPVFVNAIVGLVLRKGETPESLLKKLQAIEKEFGRKPKKVLNEARPLDLDLIAFGAERRSKKALKLPHPRAHERRFVLAPLAEIAPDLVLPGQSRTVEELLAGLSRPMPADVRKFRISGRTASDE